MIEFPEMFHKRSYLFCSAKVMTYIQNLVSEDLGSLGSDVRIFYL